MNYSKVPHLSVRPHHEEKRYAEGHEIMHLTVSLRSKKFEAWHISRHNEALSLAPSKRQYLSHQELHAQSGESYDDLGLIVKTLDGSGIAIEHVNLITGTVTLSGRAESFQKTFRTKIGKSDISGKDYVFVAGDFYVHESLMDVITGYWNTAIPGRETRFRKPESGIQNVTQDKQKGYTPEKLANAYRFPAGKGKGQCLAIIELGGVVNQSDLSIFFAERGREMPEIVTKGTPGLKDSELNNAEVTLDIQVAGAIIPEAKIVVYYAQSILEAMHIIINDQENDPSVVSISWAASEMAYSAEEIAAMNHCFYIAALKGITVIAASGDSGALNGHGFPNVNLPASNPMVLGCGGTIASENSQVFSESVWNELDAKVASGGGFSILYGTPPYQQQGLSVYPYSQPGKRGVPDIAANASTIEGYQVVYNGKEQVIGGTSAATPLWAALFILMNEHLGYRLGFVHTWLYAGMGTSCFNQVTKGNNQLYPAAPYWNASTGLGTPDGEKILNFFKTLDQQSTSDGKSDNYSQLTV